MAKHEPDWPGPVIAAVAVGMVLWLAASFISGRREPWDAAIYWSAVYPLALVVSALFGYRFPVRPWRWALALFEGQFVGMAIRNGELGGLWPLGMALFAILALPAVAAASLAASMRRRSAPE